jgi:hypothetical protein
MQGIRPYVITQRTNGKRFCGWCGQYVHVPEGVNRCPDCGRMLRLHARNDHPLDAIRFVEGCELAEDMYLCPERDCKADTFESVEAFLNHLGDVHGYVWRGSGGGGSQQGAGGT